MWTAVGQRSFAVNGPTTRNSLPSALRTQELSQNAFIHALNAPVLDCRAMLRRFHTIPMPNTNALNYLLIYLLTYLCAAFCIGQLQTPLQQLAASAFHEACS